MQASLVKWLGRRWGVAPACLREKTIVIRSLERSGCRALVVDEFSAAKLTRVLERLSNKLLILMPDACPPHRDAIGSLAHG